MNFGWCIYVDEIEKPISCKGLSTLKMVRLLAAAHVLQLASNRSQTQDLTCLKFPLIAQFLIQVHLTGEFRVHPSTKWNTANLHCNYMRLLLL
jgi:hypothetical protein